MKILTNKKYNELKNNYENKINSLKNTADIFVKQCENYEEDINIAADMLSEISPKMKKDDIFARIGDVIMYLKN